MTTTTAARVQAAQTPGVGRALVQLYAVRVVFAFIWVGLMLGIKPGVGAFLTIMLIVYPLFDAAAVYWQIRHASDQPRVAMTQWLSVGGSVAVAIAMGVSSAFSAGVALGVWGVWAIVAGIPQLATAIGNRKSGGQVAQMFSGGISVIAGAMFLSQAIGGSDEIVSVANYAAIGGVFFLISTARLAYTLRKDDKVAAA